MGSEQNFGSKTIIRFFQPNPKFHSDPMFRPAEGRHAS